MASRRIEDLHKLMQPIAKEFLLRADDILGSEQAFITDGFRSNEEQTSLYASGRTKTGNILTYAKAGQSPHNYGLAIDIAFRDDGTRGARWTLANYKKLSNLAKELGLTWGGTWSNFKDNPHYEYKTWQDVKNNKESDPMPNKETELQACLRMHGELVDEAGVKDKQIAAQKGLVTQAEKKVYSLETELAEVNLQVKELQNKPGKPVEAIKDPIRYVVSMAIAASLTYAYTQFPVLGELQPDQQALAAVLVGLVIKGIDKYQHETGRSLKLPF